MRPAAARGVVVAWPCPRATEGTEACKKRFWSDGERRRSPTEVRRELRQTEDTFASRFYDGLTTRSPCDRIYRGQLRIIVHDRAGVPRRGVEVDVSYDNGGAEKAVSNDVGECVFPMDGTHETATVRYAINDVSPVEVHADM